MSGQSSQPSIHDDDRIDRIEAAAYRGEKAYELFIQMRDMVKALNARNEKLEQKVDETLGAVVREAAKAASSAERAEHAASEAKQAAERAANEAVRIGATLKDYKDDWRRECSFLRQNIEARIDRTEERVEDQRTFGGSGKSGVLHVNEHPELLAARYDEQAKQIKNLQELVADFQLKLDQAAMREAAEKKAREEVVHLAEQERRRFQELDIENKKIAASLRSAQYKMWAAVATAVVGAAATITVALMAMN